MIVFAINVNGPSDPEGFTYKKKDPDLCRRIQLMT